MFNIIGIISIAGIIDIIGIASILVGTIDMAVVGHLSEMEILR